MLIGNIFIFILCYTALVGVGVLGDKNFETRSRKIRLIGGKYGQPLEFPFLVKVLTFWTTCSGAIIHSKWVITAAHCVHPKPLMARIVTIQSKSNLPPCCAQRKTIKRVFPHEQYSGKPFYEHNIALLELKQRLVFFDYVLPINLPWDLSSWNIGNANLVSWEPSLFPPHELVQYSVNLSIINRTTCKVLWWNNGLMLKLPENTLCSTFWANFQDRTSGAPLMKMSVDNSYELVGMYTITTQIPFQSMELNARLITILPYLDWINRTIGITQREWEFEKLSSSNYLICDAAVDKKYPRIKRMIPVWIPHPCSNA